MYLRVAKAYPGSKEAPEADFGILLSLLQEKKYDAFVPRVDGFIKRYPQHPLAGQALMQLGDYYQQQRMGEKAIKTYRDLIHLYPGSEWAEEAKFQIGLLHKEEIRGRAKPYRGDGEVHQGSPKSHLFADVPDRVGRSLSPDQRLREGVGEVRVGDKESPPASVG